MKHKNFLAAFAMALTFLVQPLSSAGYTATAPLLDRVQAAINSHARSDQIDVKAHVVEDEVTLRGTVEDARLKDEVSLAVAKVPGVNVIINEIQKQRRM